MNKKILAAAFGLLVSSVVCADDMKFYVGGDLGYNKLGYTSDFKTNTLNGYSKKSKAPAATLVFGVRPHANFGAEVGYTFFKKVKFNHNVNANTKKELKLNSIHADLLGFMPINDCFEVVGAFGVGRLHQTLKTTNAQDDKNTNGTVRFGAGVQYNFDEHFATRAMVRYHVAGTKNEDIKRMTSFNLGVAYTI